MTTPQAGDRRPRPRQRREDDGHAGGSGRSWPRGWSLPLPGQGPGPLPAAPTPLGERAFSEPRRPDETPVAVRRDFLFASGSVADAMDLIVRPVVYAWVES